jgi:ribonuclease P/MRP protein subunit POP5
MNTANKIGLWLLELNWEKKFGIIRCSHITKEIVISALSLIKEINNERVIISPIKTSGTIKKVREIVKTFNS